MIQEIAPHSYHNEYSIRQPENKDTILVYQEGNVFFKPGTEEFLSYSEYQKLLSLVKEKSPALIYLFSIDEQVFFLATEATDAVREQCEVREVNLFRTYEPMHLAFAGITGWNLYQWYRNNQYCGVCSMPMEPDDKERAMRCFHCGNLVYPTISPAVIVGIRNKNKLLLTKYSRGNYKKYALIAGFTEVGESMEDTVHREVMEEVGLKVKNLTYYKSQPWPFTGTELMGFYADLDGDDKVTLEEDELKEGTWFEREELPETDGHISLTAEMIEAFRAEKDK